MQTDASFTVTVKPLGAPSALGSSESEYCVLDMHIGSERNAGSASYQERQLLPKKVEALAGQRVVVVSAGEHHSLALTTDGAVWSWGDGALGQLGHGDQQNQLLPKKVETLEGWRVVAVSAGSDHSLALTADGASFAWGKGESGCLGHGEDLSNQLLPKKVEAWAPGL